MLSSGAIRSRIAAIVDSLCRTAVTEITKVVEDGMMVLRLETVYRESEIKRLKGDIERLHVELRAGQETGATPRRDHGPRDALPLHSNDRSMFILSPLDTNSSASVAQRREMLDRGEEPARHPEHPPRDATLERDGDQGAQQNSALGPSENSAALLTNHSLDVGPRGAPFGYSPYQSVFRAEPRKEKTLNICPYCGKCFERAAHLERHKRIHTGEKPYQCETCGRCFNQNCSLKEHRKLHLRDAQLALQKASEQNPALSNSESNNIKPSPNPNANPNANTNPVTNPNSNCSDAQSPGENACNAFQTKDALVIPAVQIKSEPVEPSIEPPAQITFNHTTQEDGGDLCDRLEPLMSSFPILHPISPPPPGLGSSCGDVQPYYMKDGQLLDMQKRAPRPKRMYPCQYCPKVFGRSEHLERHVRIHTGEKPFGCYICGRCFSQKSSLKGHMRTHGNDRLVDMSLGDNSGLLDPQPASLTSANPSFINIFDPALGQNSQEGGWRHVASVKLEPKEEPLDSECTSQDQPWTSEVFDDQDLSKVEDMEYDHAEINIEIIPNNHGTGLVKAEPILEEARTQNGNALEVNHTTSDEKADCDVGEKGMSSYICSVCGDSYEDFNLFQKHQCLEQEQTGEL